MTPRTASLLGAGCLLAGGFTLLWAVSWKVAVGVFVIWWGNNWWGNTP